jgi:signal peptidase II
MFESLVPVGSPRLPVRIALIAALLGSSIGCDQATKRIATDALKGNPAITMVGGVVRLQYAENEGAFLSMGAQLPEWLRFWIFTVGVAGILGGALLAAVARRNLTHLDVISLALVAGGGLSNWMDRLGGGRVVDFMNLGIGPVRTGIFNVADLAIVAGVVLVALRRSPKQPAPSP